MEYFLQRIARHLYSLHGNKLHDHCLVFPNRRAGLFFKKYLAGVISKPVWTPAVMTINDLFRSFSEFQPAENEILIFELYNVFRKINKESETFDDFYFWGDMLLNDFDDIDKYLADASAVFRNVHDIRKIDEEFGGLTPEQIEIVRQFWTNIDPARLTREKSGFLNIWAILYELYKNFKASLKAKNIAYEGMIFRDVAENHIGEIVSGLQWKEVHFVGFNALNSCERSLMSALRKAGKARFYWDYDESYITGIRLNSAGYFLKDNIAVFGNDMPADWKYNTLLSRDETIVTRRIISTSSDMAQVKLVPRLINELSDMKPENAHHTAVILADENLLIPVLSSLPENIDSINVTMGFPLKHTRVYAFIRRILEMQRKSKNEKGIILFNFRDFHRIVTDNLISGLFTDQDRITIKGINRKSFLWIPSDMFAATDILSRIFIKPSTPELLSDYLRELLMIISSENSEAGEEEQSNSTGRRIRDEFIYRILLSLNRLDSAARSSGIDLTTATWTVLLDRILSIQSVPFTGEPLSGIQVMGILESRTLDFRNIILLSVNEGILPSVTTSSSFIPFNLREAFGLPSINHQESIYAYHFFRLLHRSENITFIYNSNSEGLRSGEISRFLQQMKYGDMPVPDTIDLSFTIKSQKPVNEIVERTAEHTLRLIKRFSGNGVVKNRYISPSAINTWLNCRMKFYYTYVNGLAEKDKITEEIDPAKLGTLLHDSIMDLYAKYKNSIINSDEIESIISNRQQISNSVGNAIKKNFTSVNDVSASGNEHIIREVLMVFIDRILQRDKLSVPLKILSFEEAYSFEIKVHNSIGDIDLITGGKIDRVDMREGVTRIIDYKTGKVKDSISSIEELFEDDRDKDLDGWLQTLIYCEAYLAQNPGISLFPVIYKVKKAPEKDLSEMLLIKPDLLLADYQSVRTEFLANLKITLEKIFNNDEAFVMTKNQWGKCGYCPYRVLCQR